MNLLQNGLHSLSKGIQNWMELEGKEGEEREFVAKEVILSLHHSVETLFKYIVMDKSSILIYDNLQEYFDKEMNKIVGSGSTEFNVKTISFMEAIKRASVLHHIDMSKTEFGSLERINGLRNAITHHEYDLSEKEIEFLVTQVLTTIFPIYKLHIKDFNEYIRDKNLNLNSTKQVNDYHIWRFVRFLSLHMKMIESQKKIREIISNQNFERKQKQIKKEDYIHYHTCPGCKKRFFVKENLIIEDAEEVGYYGKCLMCELDLTKDDAMFINMTFRSYEMFLDEFQYYSSVMDELLLEDEFLVKRIKEQDKEVLNGLLDHFETRQLVEEFTRNCMYDFTLIRLDSYVDDIVHKYDAAEMDNAATFGCKINDSVTIEELDEEDDKDFKELFAKLEELQIPSSIYLNFSDEEYVYHRIRSHPNPHHDGEEDQIEINLTLTLGSNFLRE